MKPAPQFTEEDLGFIQLASNEVLAAVARGELDLNGLACRQLAGRGMNAEPKWVGFAYAKALLPDPICEVCEEQCSVSEAEGNQKEWGIACCDGCVEGGINCGALPLGVC